MQETRMEGCSGKVGFLIYQDVMYHSSRFPLNWVARYALFRTADYDSRIYSYENDMTGVYSVPSYYGQGQRCYFLVQWKISREFELWLKAARTLFTDRNEIGSGPAMISGNHRTDIGIEGRIRF